MWNVVVTTDTFLICVDLMTMKVVYNNTATFSNNLDYLVNEQPPIPRFLTTFGSRAVIFVGTTGITEVGV